MTECTICRRVEAEKDDYCCKDCRVALYDYAEDSKKYEQIQQERLDSLVRSECHTNCGDCGKFVSKDLWIKKSDAPKVTHTHCLDCLSNYDGMYDY